MDFDGKIKDSPRPIKLRLKAGVQRLSQLKQAVMGRGITNG